jgi:hypothetical protein
MALIHDVVRPGDVITSDLINRIIGTLNQHDALITAQPGGTAVTITAFAPSPPFQIGQAIEIQGTNFGFSTGSTVLTFDATPVTAFKLGSSNSALLIDVPLLNVGTGKDVVLLLSNGTSSVARVVRVNPAQQPQQGNVDVLSNDAITPNPNPNPVLNSQAVTIAYLLRSRALLPATFTIGVQCSDASMQAAAQVLDASQVVIPSKQIELAPDQQKGFFIRFPDVPVANNNPFTVTVSASTLGVSGSDTRTFIVNQVVAQPDPSITVSFNALTATDPNTGLPDPTASYTVADNTVRLKQGTIGRINLLARFTLIGTYDVSVVPVAPTANWAVTLAGGPSQYQIQPSDFSGGVATRNPEIGIQAQAGATATGQLRFTLQRQGSTQTREVTFNLARIP